jgi:class 3 adenylate cyclase
VFAGNIGAENRHEYTVVGDAVNEAARLADRAKDSRPSVASAAAIERASAGNGDAASRAQRWRGRSRLTQISAPV